MPKSLIVCAIAIVVTVGADAQTPPQHEDTRKRTISSQSEFASFILRGLPVDELASASFFVLAAPDVAVPSLTQALTSALEREPTQPEFAERIKSLIVYPASTQSMDAIALLCLRDEARFSPLVERVLDHAINREREFDIAAYGAANHPLLRAYIGRWLERNLKLPLSESVFAATVIRSEKENGPDRITRPLFELMSRPSAERLLKVVDDLRKSQRQ